MWASGALILAALGPLLTFCRPELALLAAYAWPLLGGLGILLGLMSALLLWSQGARAKARARGLAEVSLAAGGSSLRIETPSGEGEPLLFLVQQGGALEPLPPWAELTRIEVLPRARRGLFGWRGAWPSARVRFVWAEATAPPSEGAREDAPAETAPAETAPAEAAPAETALAETAPAETALAETAPAETTLAETAPAETAPAEAASAGEPARPEEPIRHASTFELASWAANAFLGWCVLQGVEVRDPEGAYPEVGAARAAQGAELFWPPPRGAALRYFGGFAVTILSVCALPAALMLIAEALRAPGTRDLASHLVWMARPVAEVVGLLCLGALGLTGLQVAFLRVKVLRAARRFQLLPGERLLALCYARTRRAWPPLPPPEPKGAGEDQPQGPGEDQPQGLGEDQPQGLGEDPPQGLGEDQPRPEPEGAAPAAAPNPATPSRPLGAEATAPAEEARPLPPQGSSPRGASREPAESSAPPEQPPEQPAAKPKRKPKPKPGTFPPGPLSAGAAWGEFVAITETRILQLLFGEGRNLVTEVCRREDLVGWAHLPPARHPLQSALRYLRSDGRGVRFWTRDGRELQLTTEVLFHEPLLAWLEERAGYRIEDWGYLPLELPGWVRSERDPRRAERSSPQEPAPGELAPDELAPDELAPGEARGDAHADAP